MTCVVHYRSNQCQWLGCINSNDNRQPLRLIWYALQNMTVRVTEKAVSQYSQSPVQTFINSCP